ncbi:hypothetical protein YTPLAS18_18630 [Nitrospira sp.]|nr:hypothetical protein YTPLAS18_18630 [Nitrospira sp.]
MLEEQLAEVNVHTSMVWKPGKVTSLLTPSKTAPEDVNEAVTAGLVLNPNELTT